MANFTNAIDVVSSPRNEKGITPFYRKYNILAADLTLNDTFVLAAMPDNCYMRKVTCGILASDMDTHGSPTLDFDIGFGTKAGVESLAIIDGSQAARTGVADAADSGVADVVNLSGLYLILKIAAASATAAAGTLEIWFDMFANHNLQTIELKSR